MNRRVLWSRPGCTDINHAGLPLAVFASSPILRRTLRQRIAGQRQQQRPWDRPGWPTAFFSETIRQRIFPNTTLKGNISSSGLKAAAVLRRTGRNDRASGGAAGRARGTARARPFGGAGHGRGVQDWHGHYSLSKKLPELVFGPPCQCAPSFVSWATTSSNRFHEQDCHAHDALPHDPCLGEVLTVPTFVERVRWTLSAKRQRCLLQTETVDRASWDFSYFRRRG